MMKEGEIMPHIHGLNKTTLLDYPGRVAATVFLGGCNFRCPFCQNSSLVRILPRSRRFLRKKFCVFSKSGPGFWKGSVFPAGNRH